MYHRTVMIDNDTRSAILEGYLPLIRFFAQQFPDTEFVLHDVSRLDHSIIAIENSRFSNRAIGDSATDLVLRILKGRSYETTDYTEAYMSSSESGKIAVSGTYFIKHRGELVGMLCINTDFTPLQQLKAATDALVSSHYPVDQIASGLRSVSAEPTPEEVLDRDSVSHAQGLPYDRPPSIDERLSRSVTSIPIDTTLAVVAERNLQLDRMTQDERMDVVRELENRGVFLLKGAIGSVAKVLHVSEPTLYRDLRMVRA